jgi:hypothetical protein
MLIPDFTLPALGPSANDSCGHTIALSALRAVGILIALSAALQKKLLGLGFWFYAGKV